MPLDKLIKMSKQVVEPCVWSNRMLSICLLISLGINAICILHIIN
jgi:hypothetical protein